MIRASIDIGSNSVLLLVAEVNGTIQKELFNRSFVTSLSRDLDKVGAFHADSMNATYEALTEYKKNIISIGLNVNEVKVTATEAARVAKNAEDFFKKIKSELGFVTTIISGEGEAYYTALGVVSNLKDENKAIIMDIGGASTELIKVNLNPFKIENSISLPVGSVRATDWKNDKIFDSKIESILAVDVSQYRTETLVCVAGSMTSLASMFFGIKEYSENEIDGKIINFNEFEKFSNALQFTNSQELLLNFPFLGKRAKMVSAGADVAQLIGKKLDIKNIKISTKGLRYGVLLAGEIDEQFKIK